MKHTYDLSQLEWRLSGWIPELWRMQRTMEIGASPDAEIPALPAKVPGSVQYSLREAGILPDWNVGLNFRECEWVENRHWIYEAVIPDEWIEVGKTVRLNCLGLDYRGEVYLNGRLVSGFEGSHIPHVFDLTPHLQKKDNLLRIVFLHPPRWLGQFGYTSKMRDWKVRFNYTWDWTVRLVQIGIWDEILLEVTDDLRIERFGLTTDADLSDSSGTLKAWGLIPANAGSVRLALSRNGEVIREEELPIPDFNSSGIEWHGLPVELWWPNLEGNQPLYEATFTLLDGQGIRQDEIVRRVGFRRVEWVSAADAPEQSDPWVCVVNGRPVFLQGANWVPIRPNFADVTEEDYRRLLGLYKDLGANVLRVWGGAVLERECFYDICDEHGIMVWQEFPLSSSGLDNWPPDESSFTDQMGRIAESYIARRQHHVSLIMWSGGNELEDLERRPVTTGVPIIKRMQEVVNANDPGRRFVATSPSGPCSGANPENFGRGMHWDVHGPWKAEGKISDGWTRFFANDDSLFRSETGAPGASSAEIIRKYAGALDPMPATYDNPLWRRTSTWWIEWHQFMAEHGREPESLEEYVAWSQERQKEALVVAARTCKDRFPSCGGIIIWMGHDCFPCTANTAIIDFEGNPKPAALALKKIWRQKGDDI